jgi:ABC transporter substrate binding protein (PQQ-dependent alcohol dehydrogenase system)
LLSHAASVARVLHLNIGCSADDLRGAGCRPETFHVMPSDAMLRDAVALSGHPADAWAAAWDPSLVRFGADTLNQRFRARFRQSMTADAWTAWVAVKMLWEASLRTRATDSAAIGAYLRAESTQFDGHKGRPLSFRSWDQQLRQPMYVVARGTGGATRVIAELPAATTDTETSRDVLDRLGIRQVDSRCRLAS